MFKQRFSNKSAFTLIEIIVSAGIMAVTIAGIFSVFIAGTKFVSRSQRRLQAVNVAQGKIERRRINVLFGPDWESGAPNPVPLLNGLFINSPGFTNWSNALLTMGMTAYRYQVDYDYNTSPYDITEAVAKCRRMYMQVKWLEVSP